MPELPEVETVRRGLAPVMVGACLARVELRRPDLRFPLPERFVQRLTGQRITALTRRAKYLVAELEGGEALILHLGMTGRFLIVEAGRHDAPGRFHHPAGHLSAHDHVVFHLDRGAGQPQISVIYNDVRRFGFMDLVKLSDLATCRHFAAMGLEPLGNALSGETLAMLLAGKSAPLKAVLLDQRLIAGLGNIYVCEALFRAGLNPQSPAGSLALPSGRPRQAAHRLAAVIRTVLEEAIAAGGSTLRDFAHADGSLGYFQHTFRVYDRAGQPCITPACDGIVERIVQSGRSSFFCPRCQPMATRAKRRLRQPKP